MAKGLIRTTVQGCLLGAGLYLGADVVGEYTTYLRLRDAALEFAETSEELRAQIGHPYSIGPWYNASIGISHAGHIAAVRFQLQGQAQVTDVTVRAVRKPGAIPGLALYNLLGPGKWKVMDCSAMFPSGGGLVRSRSIMPEEPMPKIENGEVVQGEDCETCKKPAQQAGSPVAAQAPKVAAA